MNIIEAATQAQETINQLSARIAMLAAENTSAIAAKDAEIAAVKTELAMVHTFHNSMVQKVTEVVAANDPAAYEALAKEFLLPTTEKARLEKVAKLEDLKAQQAALEAALAS